MESQNNPSITKPSKQFLIRGGIATGILALILLIQTPWFLGIFSKKGAKGIVVTDATVGEIVGKDSNGNGIADWEERLWGLDPTVSTTNGVSNKSIIEAKRRTLQNSGDTGPLNETDRLARELFGFTNALSDSSINKDGLAALAVKLGSNGASIDKVPTYTIKNIKTSQTTIKNLTFYRKSLFDTLNKKNSNLPELDLLIKGIETGDYSRFDEFDETTIYYESIAKSLIKITVPIGVAQYHLDITNAVSGISKSFQKIKTLEDNGVSALVGLSEYRYHEQRLTDSLEKMTIYFNQYGIIQ